MDRPTAVAQATAVEHLARTARGGELVQQLIDLVARYNLSSRVGDRFYQGAAQGFVIAVFEQLRIGKKLDEKLLADSAHRANLPSL